MQFVRWARLQEGLVMGDGHQYIKSITGKSVSQTKKCDRIVPV